MLASLIVIDIVANWSEGGPHQVVGTASTAVLIGTLLGGAVSVRRQRALAADRVRAAALNERLRIARDLHDAVANRLSALALRVTAARALTSRHGLVGMTERAIACGGTLVAGPRSDGGWSVEAYLPVPPQGHHA
ncbi:histidine kinase [Dactylosporangium sp. NPDC000555]|uniref:histidine kinase n=1 Tax=Dactylosporangium sp. NPDC000555 TaxID=3154260 RepID=UPI00332DDB5C